MKKTFIFTLAALTILFFFNEPSFSEIGVKFGPQRSDFDTGTDNLSRYKFGFFLPLKIFGTERIILQPEIYFSHLGTRYISVHYPQDITDFRYVETEQYRDVLSYLEVPLLLKFKFPVKGSFKPILFAGGYFSLRVSKNIEFSTEVVNWLKPDQNQEIWSGSEPIPYSYDDIYYPYNPLDAGVVLGIGLEHDLGKTEMILDWRVNIGMTRVYQGALARDTRNHAMSFMIGIRF